MSPKQKLPDGTYGPVAPEPYHPGYDLERYSNGRWVLYRTTRQDSVEVAMGRTWLGGVAAYWWHRLRLADWAWMLRNALNLIRWWPPGR